MRLLHQVQGQLASEDFQDADLGTIYTVLLHLAPQSGQTAFPGILHALESPKQKQLLNQIEIEACVLSNPAEVSAALRDCLNKIRQRQRKAQGQRTKAQLDGLGDAADEERRILQEYVQHTK